MTREHVEADFTGCDAALLNRFFRWYYGEHGQGGTNTKQRNLRHLFTWLEVEYGHPHPYTDKLIRFAPVKTRPATLAADFIKELLEGVHRSELVQVGMSDLPADVVAQPYVRVVPLKGARAEDEGRIVPLTLATARALVVYLRARSGHRLAGSSSALWLGTRNRGPFGGWGVYRMLQRRAEEAGYGPRFTPICSATRSRTTG